MSETLSERTLTVQQQQALELLAAGRGVGQIAKEIHISERQLLRWRTDDVVFKSAWEELLATLWENTKVGLKALGGKALQVLFDIMEDKDASRKDKLDASKTVLANLHKVVTDDELRKRVEALVFALEAQNGNTPVN